MKFTNPEMRDLYRDMKPLGWTVERTNGGHYKFTYTNGARIYTSSTPSDRRSVINCRLQMEREMKKAQPPGKPVTEPSNKVQTPPFNGIRFPSNTAPAAEPKPAPIAVKAKPAVGLREAALALRDLCDAEKVVRVVLEKKDGKWTLETRREVVTTETGEL